MKYYRVLCLLAGILAIALLVNPVFAQDEQTAATTQQTAASAVAEKAEQPMQPEEMSVYGEVQSTDQGANSVKLQYYDYDSDEEKVMDLVLDKDTKMENAAAVSDIKQGDWIDAVYITKDSKNIAKSIIVEKEEEEAPPTEAPAAAGKAENEPKPQAKETSAQ